MVTAGVHDTRTIGRGLGVIRAIANGFTTRMLDLEESGADEEQRRETFRAATLRDAALHGNTAEGKLEAGQSAGLVDSVLPAAHIVERIVAEYRMAVAALPLPRG